jgi:E3 Ubiquitin ligase
MQDGVRLYMALAACTAIAAAYAIYRLFASVGRDRFVTDTPLVRIRSAAQGYARIEGHAGRTGPDVLVAPLSGRPCVWWDYRISVKETDSRGNSKWSPLESATSVTPFALADLDGRCLVGPVGAEVTPTDSDTWYGDTPRPVAGPPQNGWIGSLDHTYRYTERLLGPGARLSVLGELRSHAEEREIDGDARSLLSTWKADQPDLLARFDRDHDGRIDPQEWEAARAAARDQAARNVADSRIERTNVVAQPTHGQPFLIAPLDGRQLAHRERRNAWLFLAAAVLLLGLTVWSLHKARRPFEPAAEPRSVSS